MGDRVAFYKYLRIGDFLRGPEERECVIAQTDFVRPGWGNAASPIQRGAGGTFKITVPTCMQLGYFSAAETVRQFEGRRLQYLKDMRTLAGFIPGTFAQRGTLSIIEDYATDVTTAVTGPPAGSEVTFTLAAGIGVAVNDRILIFSGTMYDTPSVTNVSGQDVTVDLLNNSYPDGAPVARLLYLVPNCCVQQAPKIPGGQPGTNRASLDMQWIFESADDPAWSLP